LKCLSCFRGYIFEFVLGGGTGALAYIHTTPNNEFDYRQLEINARVPRD